MSYEVLARKYRPQTFADVVGQGHVVDTLKNGGIALVMNTTEGQQAVEDSREIRSVALNDKIPYFTTAAASHAAALAMKARNEGDIEVRALQA